MSKGSVFLDSGYFVALINWRDALHQRARELAKEWADRRRDAVTADGVLIEVANFFARSPLRLYALSANRAARAARNIEVVPLSGALVERGEVRFGAHPDKSWSSTDCISMEVMLDRGAREAATLDHHFAQAGFVVLMQ